MNGWDIIEAMHSSRWSNTTKIVVLTILLILFVGLFFALRVMIAPTIVGCLLAFVLSHPVNWLQRRTGWGRSSAIVVVYLILVLVLAAMPALFIPRILDSLDSLQNVFSNLITNLQATSVPLFQLGDFHVEWESLLAQVNSALQEGLSTAAAGLFTLALDLTTGILISIYALVLAFWLLRDGYKLQRTLLERIPAEYQNDMVRLGRQLSETWEGFLQGQVVLAVVMGLIVWVVMGIVGLPNVGGLALLAAVMEFLPSIGPAVSGWIGTAVALFQGPSWHAMPNLPFAVLVGILYFIIAQVENIYLVPRLIGGRVKLDATVALLGVISGTIVFGALGVLLATPVIASARIIFAYIYRKLADLEPFEPLRWDDPGVRIPGLVAGRKVEGVIFDLDGTLAQIDWRMAATLAHQFDWAEEIVGYEQRQAVARRLMQEAEGAINRWISLLIWLRRGSTLARMLPLLDGLRALAPVESMQPVEGTTGLLRALESHYRLGLVTTRSREEATAFFAQIGFSLDRFDSVVTGEAIRHLPPHSEALSLALAQLGLNAGALLMVADSEVQLRPARALGLATVGVTCGLSDADHLADADLILCRPAELEDRL